MKKLGKGITVSSGLFVNGIEGSGGNWIMWKPPVVAKSLEDACLRRMNGENVVGYPDEKGELTVVEGGYDRFITLVA